MGAYINLTAYWFMFLRYYVRWNCVIKCWERNFLSALLWILLSYAVVTFLPDVIPKYINSKSLPPLYCSFYMPFVSKIVVHRLVQAKELSNLQMLEHQYIAPLLLSHVILLLIALERLKMMEIGVTLLLRLSLLVIWIQRKLFVSSYLCERVGKRTWIYNCTALP